MPHTNNVEMVNLPPNYLWWWLGDGLWNWFAHITPNELPGQSQEIRGDVMFTIYDWMGLWFITHVFKT